MPPARYAASASRAVLKRHRAAGNQVCFRGQKRLERYPRVCRVQRHRLHPVSLELIGKARTLAKAVPGFKVRAVLVGNGVSACAEELRHYGVAEIAVYDPTLHWATSGQTHMQPALRTISARAAQAWCWWEQRRWDAALPPELPPASYRAHGGLHKAGTEGKYGPGADPPRVRGTIWPRLSRRTPALSSPPFAIK